LQKRVTLGTASNKNISSGQNYKEQWNQILWKYRKCNTIQTFCSKVRFLQSFDRNGPQCPIRFFSQEQETISLSAFSARNSIAISIVAPSPSSAFMPCACQHHKMDNNKLKSHERMASQIQKIQMVKDVQPSKNYLCIRGGIYLTVLISVL
jgi:hypothetical protein